MNCRDTTTKPLRGILIFLLLGITAGHCGGATPPQRGISGSGTGGETAAPSSTEDSSLSPVHNVADVPANRIEGIVFDDASLGSHLLSCDEPGEKPAGVRCEPNRVLCELGVNRYRFCDELYMGNLLPELQRPPEEAKWTGPLPMLPILLYQMKEPPLHTRNRTEPVEAYRITMMSWAHIDTMRLERNGDRGPGLAIRKLAERGPNNLWIHTREISTVDEATWSALSRLFTDMDFWNGAHHRSNEIGKDGYIIYLEGLGPEGYQTVARWGPTALNGTTSLVQFLRRVFQENRDHVRSASAARR